MEGGNDEIVQCNFNQFQSWSERPTILAGHRISVDIEFNDADILAEAL